MKGVTQNEVSVDKEFNWWQQCCTIVIFKLFRISWSLICCMTKDYIFLAISQAKIVNRDSNCNENLYHSHQSSRFTQGNQIHLSNTVLQIQQPTRAVSWNTPTQRPALSTIRSDALLKTVKLPIFALVHIQYPNVGRICPSQWQMSHSHHVSLLLLLEGFGQEGIHSNFNFQHFAPNSANCLCF